MIRQRTVQDVACTLIAILLVGLQAASTPPAAANPMTFGPNAYEFVAPPDPFIENNNAWATASAAAASRVVNNMNGHLATITSQAENDFLLSLVSDNYSGFAGAWLGGKAPQGWLTGPEDGQSFSYTNWGGIEPNNSGFAYMNIGSLFAGIGRQQWADDSDGMPDPYFDPVIGYFVEYEGAAAGPGLYGDYNNNGVVDAADYVLWRKNNDTAVILRNDWTPGTDLTDYDIWRAHFDQTAGAGLGDAYSPRAAVPEPVTGLLLGLGALGISGFRTRRSRVN